MEPENHWVVNENGLTLGSIFTVLCESAGRGVYVFEIL